MKKKISTFFIAISLFVILSFGCKGTGKTHNGGGTDDPDLVLKTLTVATVPVTNVIERPMNVSVANDKASLSSTNIEATFDYGSQTGKPITIQIDGASNLKEGVASLCTLSVPASPGKYKSWSAKINITRLANGGGAGELKNIEIDKIILGYPNISSRDGKTVKGKDLNEDYSIPDFTVPATKFPVQVYHTTEFTVEKVEIRVNGGNKEEIPSPITKSMINRDYTLVENAKTKFEISITGEGYKPLKLTFNVTYEKATKKYVDDLTNITITTNSLGKTAVYGATGTSIEELKEGKTTIDVSIPRPKMTIIVNKGEGAKQAKATISIDANKVNQDFAQGSGKLEFVIDTLAKGSHNVKITIEKEGYEKGDYDFNLNYKPPLTFKEIKINEKTFTDVAQIKNKTIEIEPTDPDPVVLSGKAEEEGVNLYFSKRGNDNKYHKITDSKVSVAESETVILGMYAKKDGYTTLFIPFKVKRKKTIEPIVVKRIEVGSKAVAEGESITLTQEEAQTKLTLTLKQKYEGITFKINNVEVTPDLGIYGMIATFNNVALTANGSKTFALKAQAPDFLTWQASITIVHVTPPEEESYIIEPKIGYFDSDDGWWDYDLKRDGNNWKGSCDPDSSYRFTVKIQKKDKDLSDPSKFKLSIVDKSDSDKVHLDKVTTSIVDKTKGHLTWIRDKNTVGRDMRFSRGLHEFEVTIYFEDKVIETTKFNIKIGN